MWSPLLHFKSFFFCLSPFPRDMHEVAQSSTGIAFLVLTYEKTNLFLFSNKCRRSLTHFDAGYLKIHSTREKNAFPRFQSRHTENKNRKWAWHSVVTKTSVIFHSPPPLKREKEREIQDVWLEKLRKCGLTDSDKNIIVISGDYGAFGQETYCLQKNNKIFIANGIGDLNTDTLLKLSIFENKLFLEELKINSE